MNHSKRVAAFTNIGALRIVDPSVAISQAQCIVRDICIDNHVFI